MAGALETGTLPWLMHSGEKGNGGIGDIHKIIKLTATVPFGMFSVYSDKPESTRQVLTTPSLSGGLSGKESFRMIRTGMIS
jgi:hypothetical protein